MRIIGLIAAGLLPLVPGAAGALAADQSGKPQFNPQLTAYIHERSREFEQVPEPRKDELKRIALYVRRHIDAGQPARLVFICTHNSRRSHLSQIWATHAAGYYNIPDVECFSGGTESTAFNSRAVAAIERAGITIDKTNDDQKNPRYRVQVAEGLAPLICFSKKYSDAPNPKSDFCAVMTCSDADKSCPVVEGAALRVAIHYEDPKAADGAPHESSTYDDRCAQICREMLYLFSQVHPAAP